ncbi:methionine--tRNA ligase [Candidatus Peregrinibacteria bacterium]|nr:MAG: methionine--tRNA ligase [Candidatus Peregrinibacteria bacterium]
MSKFYLTNAIAYVNAGPHMGHALELCQGDALTRYHRMIGDEVLFMVGTDEHGSKIAQVAKEKGMEPQVLTDQNAALFMQMNQAFSAANDDFIRTTSDLHKRGAQKIWKLIEAAGKFYEKEYEGKYCTGCEAFVLEKDLVEGKCSIHLREPQVLKEKNIFFKLSDYSDAIEEKVKSGELEIRPESRRNEFLSLLKEGLQDVSFSRPKSSLTWGIDVPGMDDQVMYVWCDALTNYLTALGYADDDAKWKKFWPADVHLIGKDIIRFHCGIWIGMLMAAQLPLPKAVYVHGFVTSEGQKMSKTLGNVVNPMELVDRYGVDAVRYYLLREIPSDGDGDFSQERFKTVYKDELQNTLGNLLRRVLTLALKHFEGKVPQGDGKLQDSIDKAWKGFHEGFLSFDIKGALESVMELARAANLYVDQEKPWELAKTDKARLESVLGNLIVVCRELGRMLASVIPDASHKMLLQLGEDHLLLQEALFPPMAE